MVYLVQRDGKTHLRVVGGTVRDGILRGPGGELVINGQHAAELGIDLTPVKTLMQARKFDTVIQDYPAIVARLGDNPTGLRIVDEADIRAARQAAANAKLLALHAGRPGTGNNRRAGTCERCGCGVPAGYGDLCFCAYDTGCPEHMHEDGWHLVCADRTACERRGAAARERDRARAVRNARVYLSSRGWGDYSNVEWRGDLARPDADIIAECRSLLERADDVDQPNKTDEQLLALIASARERVTG